MKSLLTIVGIGLVAAAVAGWVFEVAVLTPYATLFLIAGLVLLCVTFHGKCPCARTAEAESKGCGCG